MGLISKIEDKLSGSHKTEPKSYENNSSGATSSVRHPISSAQQDTTSSPTTGSSTANGRDGYSSQAGKFTSTTTGRQGEQPGSYQTETRTSPTGPDSDKMPTTTTNTSTSTSTGQRQYYDPYSRKGQQTAANAAQGYGMSPSTSSSTHPNADADAARSRNGGVLNNSNDRSYDPRYEQRPGASPSTGNQDLSTLTGERNHHYGRDAGMAAGAGAAGVGAYELDRDHDRSRQNFSHPSGYSGAQNTSSSPKAGSESNMTQAQKMGHAYEAGYRDAMEHMKKEMSVQQQQLMQKFET